MLHRSRLKLPLTRQQSFNCVRDIPFSVVLAPGSPSYHCYPKAKLLRNLLPENIESRLILCQFRWSDTAVPQKIYQKCSFQEDYHNFLEIFIPETKKWVAVDPTWDSALGKAGFPIAQWDGVNPTALAVKPTKIYSPEESYQALKNVDDIPDEAISASLGCDKDFFRLLNHYLNEIRSRRSIEKDVSIS